MAVRSLIGAIAIGLAVLIRLPAAHAQADSARLVAPPAADEDARADTATVAVLAGGCFWGVQAVYQHVNGVTNVLSGYAGGERSTAKYERVGGGNTGHAESVQITFDPRVISYGRLLQVFFSVVHDPTQLNRQGPDEGPQYRSAIFPRSGEQERVAQAYLDQLARAHAFRARIATRIERGDFYQAEDYHQDFLFRNPRHPYIVFNDLPKIEDLRRLFPDLYRAQPVLARTGK